MLTSRTPKAGTTPAKATPAKACFVYGDDGNGNPTSSYASDSPFPSSVASFVSGLLPLTNVTVAASSLITGKAGATPSSFPTTGIPGSTSLSSQAAAKAGTTSTPSQTTGAAAITSTSSTTTSAPTSTTGQTTTTSQPVASSQKSAAEGTWSMFANVSIHVYVGDLESFAIFFCIFDADSPEPIGVHCFTRVIVRTSRSLRTV